LGSGMISAERQLECKVLIVFKVGHHIKSTVHCSCLLRVRRCVRVEGNSTSGRLVHCKHD